MLLVILRTYAADVEDKYPGRQWIGAFRLHPNIFRLEKIEEPGSVKYSA